MSDFKYVYVGKDFFLSFPNFTVMIISRKGGLMDILAKSREAHENWGTSTDIKLLRFDKQEINGHPSKLSH